MDATEETIDELLAGIASESVAPAGGSAVAMTGALGAALCEMGYIHVRSDAADDKSVQELETAREQLSVQRGNLIGLAEKDRRAVQEVFGDSQSPADAAEIKQALGIPLAIAEACLTVLETAHRTTEWRDRAVAADVRIGLLLTETALRGSLFIVDGNLELVSDQSFIEDTRARAARIRATAERVVGSLPLELDGVQGRE